MHKLLFLFTATLCLTNVEAQVSGPNAGSTATVVTIAGSDVTWLNPTNAFASDNNWSVTSDNLFGAGEYTDYLQVTGFGFAVPSSATITGIEVLVEKNVQTSGSSRIRDYRVRLVKNGAIGTTDRSDLVTNWASNVDVTKTYGSSTDLWGESWTYSDINNANFGVALAAERFSISGAANQFPRIDLVTIIVYWVIPLPIEITEFTATAQNDQISLQWTTISEMNNAFFTLEKSLNGIHYEQLATIAGAGNSTETLKYTFTDEHPEYGMNYYQLKQTDYNGDTQFAGTAVALNSTATEFNVFPNPVHQSMQLVLPYNTTGQSMATIYNSAGQVVGEKMITEDYSAGMPILIETANLLPGLYLLRVVDGQQYIMQQQFIKE